ncbi:cytochrome-c peroxidase [Novosphingobium album (ex Liu et al. 2023)]
MGKRALALAVLMLAASGALAQGRPGAGWWQLPAGIAPPPVPPGNAMSAAKVALGRRLFHDADLSINGTLSCATCHDQRRAFSDGVRAHPGAHGEPGLRNVPSLVNVAWFTPLTWGDPAQTTLERQALVPITGDDPIEMGMKGQEAELARRLSGNPCYRKLFRKAFPETRGRIDLASVSRALAAFERTLVSYDTPWDRARAGGDPLPEAARRGEAAFAQCAGCHAGPNFTDLRFHRLPGGAADADLDSVIDSGRDAGLARATRRAEDAGMIRTPSLRNAAITAPYLHDGSAPTLEAAIARHGLALSPARTAELVAFMGELTDRTITTDPRHARPGARCDIASGY